MNPNPKFLKIEDVGISEIEAARIVKAFQEFARSIGYKEDRISDLDCRRRDGFIPFSHNKGGIECVAFTSQYMAAMNGTGFKNADNTLDQYHRFDVDHFVEEHGYPKDYSKWTQKQYEEFDRSRDEDDEATVLFGLDIMYHGKEGTKHSANLRFTVCVKDAPYHRKFDDLISIDIEWTFHKELEAKLARILKRKAVKRFAANVEEAY